MVNCPKCGTPNPDEDSACRACGAPLAGQKFAQALDRAQSADPEQPAEQEGADEQAPAPVEQAPPEAAAPAQEPAAELVDIPVPAAAPITTEMDPLKAQAEIDRYVAQTKSRKARKSAIYLAVFVIIAGGIGFLIYRSSKIEAAKQEAARFLKSFIDINGGSVAEFWRCTVRAKHADIHLAKNNLVLIQGLEKTFRLRPKSQPDYISRKCLPVLTAAMTEVDQLKPPPDFAGALDKVKKQLPTIKTAFEGYIKSMEKMKQDASNENEVVKANEAFHDPGQSKPSLTAGYVNLMMCAVPDLVKMARSVKKIPDVQPLVDFLAVQYKTNSTGFADKLRKECFEKINSIERHKQFKLIVQRFSTDSRDGQAIKDIFLRANRNYFKKDLDAVGKSWVEYRNSVMEVHRCADKYKDETEQQKAAPKKAEPTKAAEKKK